MAEDQNLEATTLDGAAAEAVEVPAWVPEKFRSNPEEFGKAYGNLERAFHTQAAELKSQRETMEAFISEQQAAASRPPEPNQDALYAAYENDPVGTMAYLAQQAAEQAVKAVQPQLQAQQKPVLDAQNELLAYTVDRMVASQISDWDERKGQVAEFVQQRPWLLPETVLASPQTTSEALVAAYKAMRYDELQNQSSSQAEQLAQANELAKRQAQTLSGHPGRPNASDEDNDYWKSVKEVPSNRFGL